MRSCADAAARQRTADAARDADRVVRAYTGSDRSASDALDNQTGDPNQPPLWPSLDLRKISHVYRTWNGLQLKVLNLYHRNCRVSAGD